MISANSDCIRKSWNLVRENSWCWYGFNYDESWLCWIFCSRSKHLYGSDMRSSHIETCIIAIGWQRELRCPSWCWNLWIVLSSLIKTCCDKEPHLDPMIIAFGIGLDISLRIQTLDSRWRSSNVSKSCLIKAHNWFAIISGSLYSKGNEEIQS